MDITQTAAKTQGAAIYMAALGSDLKNHALKAISEALKAMQPEIVAANQKDLRSWRCPPTRKDRLQSLD